MEHTFVLDKDHRAGEDLNRAIQEAMALVGQMPKEGRGALQTLTLDQVLTAVSAVNISRHIPTLTTGRTTQ